jgi:hypothetical protein
MSNSTSNTDCGSAASTSIIHRANGGIAGLREVTDDNTKLIVLAFPRSALAEVTAAKLLNGPGCYGLSNGASVYFGESGNVASRLATHASDRTKDFATEIFVVRGIDRWFDKGAAVHFQHRFTSEAERAALVEVRKGVAPHEVDLPAWRVAMLNRAAEDAQRMMFDAGFRGFHSNNPSRLPVSARVNAPALSVLSPAAGDANADDDSGRIEIGVTTTPPGVEEYELDYCGLWARGYVHGERFVVAAGAELRIPVNLSANPIVNTRREELKAGNAVADIEGVTDRVRLVKAVAFPSAAIAAKVVTGAHVNSGKWRLLGQAQPVILAA